MHALGIALATLAALRVPGPLSPRNASYQLEARLDAASHQVRGTARLRWRNPASGPASELVFHLYLNAFKNQSSTFFRSARGHHRRFQPEPHGWGAIDIDRLLVDGAELTGALKVEDTLGTVRLPRPVPPGAEIEVELGFTSTLPRVFARTGWAEDFFAVAQWYPKVAVFDCEGGCRWRAHPLHVNAEFFADFGVYDVKLDVPAGFQVAATGVLTADTTRGARRHLRYHAEDVTDFAWATSPRFVVLRERVQDAWGSVELALYTFGQRSGIARRHLAAAREGLGWLGRHLGPYPYSSLSIVDVPPAAGGAGGMEYPTLFFTAHLPTPAGVAAPELVTVHELAHQYFQGMVATDEAEEAWLDEGLTEASTDWILSSWRGRRSSLYGLGSHHLSLEEASRLRYRTQADVDPPAQPARAFMDPASFGAATYSKPHLLLRTLEGLVGPERVARALRGYVRQWRFGHPRRVDFTTALATELGEQAMGLVRAVLDGTEVLDYEILRAESRSTHTPGGLFELDGGTRKERSPVAEPGRFDSEVVVHRRGAIRLPVELRLAFADGTERRERWDGGADGTTWRRWSHQGPRLISAELYPTTRPPLDVGRWNDGLRARPDATARGRVTGWWQLVLASLLAVVGL